MAKISKSTLNSMRKSVTGSSSTRPVVEEVVPAAVVAPAQVPVTFTTPVYEVPMATPTSTAFVTTVSLSMDMPKVEMTHIDACFASTVVDVSDTTAAEVTTVKLENTEVDYSYKVNWKRGFKEESKFLTHFYQNEMLTATDKTYDGRQLIAILPKFWERGGRKILYTPFGNYNTFRLHIRWSEHLALKYKKLLKGDSEMFTTLGQLYKTEKINLEDWEPIRRSHFNHPGELDHAFPSPEQWLAMSH